MAIKEIELIHTIKMPLSIAFGRQETQKHQEELESREIARDAAYDESLHELNALLNAGWAKIAHFDLKGRDTEGVKILLYRPDAAAPIEDADPALAAAKGTTFTAPYFQQKSGTGEDSAHLYALLDDVDEAFNALTNEPSRDKAQELILNHWRALEIALNAIRRYLPAVMAAIDGRPAPQPTEQIIPIRPIGKIQLSLDLSLGLQEALKKTHCARLHWKAADEPDEKAETLAEYLNALQAQIETLEVVLGGLITLHPDAVRGEGGASDE